MQKSEDMRMRKMQRVHGATSKDMVVCCAFIFSTCALLDAYLCFFVTSNPYGPHGVTLPIERNQSCFQPFCTVNTKGLLLDPANFYIHTPLSDILVSKLKIEGSNYFLKANFITFAHIPVALIAAKFISKDSLTHRRFGVFLFEIRNFLDCLDGSLARAGIRHQNKMAHLQNLPEKKVSNFGFWIDGICDMIGCIFLYIAIICYSRKHPPKRSLTSYSPLPSVVKSQSSSIGETNDEEDNSKPPSLGRVRQLIRSVQLSGGFNVILFALQTGLGSPFWNRYIVNYTNLLESTEGSPLTTDPEVISLRSGLLHSPKMWLVIYAWRYVNPHFFVEVLLLAVFFDKIQEVLNATKWAGFFLLCTVITFSEIHLYECKKMFQSYIS